MQTEKTEWYQTSLFDPDGWFGKMSPEPSVATKVKISESSSKKQRGSQIKTPLFLDLRGGRWTPSGCILGDGWSIAWRLHDAQFWGVPQRRKRIALVADFGGQTAPEILFERKGVSGNTEQSGTAGKGTASTFEGNVDPSSWTLKIRGGVEVDSRGKKAGKGPLIQTELSGTLGVSQDQTLFAKCYGIGSYDSNAMKSPNPHSGIYEADTTRTLDNNGGNPACNQGGMIVLEGNGARESHKGPGYAESDTMYTLNTVEQHAVCVGNGQLAQARLSDKVGALNCMHDQQAVLTYGLDRASFNQGQNAQYNFSVEEDLAQTVLAKGPGGVLTRK